MADSGATDKDSDDWLGYSAYADALWARVVRALDKDADGKKPLGDDPLVIGIFGEWGAGKSALLKLMYRRAQAQSAIDIAKRVLNAADQLPLTVTVPVMFQPWKYEHEPHLHVPLAIHVADALDEAWKTLPSDFEKVKVWVNEVAKTGEDTTAKLEAAKGWIKKLGNFWDSTIAVVKSDAAKVVAGTLDVMATTVGIPPVLSIGLNKAREHLGGGEAEAEAEATPAGDEANAGDADKTKDAKTAKEAPKPDPKTTAFAHSSDGLAFYRIHKLMHAMTRPKLDATVLKAAGLKIGKGIEFDLRINFVVFVDDLDRCLPEKAVETLELIKTMFNIESFAFVLALDDEVIERGIGHRYKDYQLVGKKPEMPITGFEYLEKIVHVPFRLPALTKPQAEEFVRQYEAAIEAKPELRWFDSPAVVDPAMGSADADNKTAKPRKGNHLGESAANFFGEPDHRAVQQADLLALALSSFDVFVPRKLIRMVELMHQVAAIAILRASPLSRNSTGGADIRVVMALVLIQLFQPELFRIMRRRPESFPALLRAFAKPAETSQATEPELMDAKVSDPDLWRWAVKPNVTFPPDPELPSASVPMLWKPSPQEAIFSYAVQRIIEEHPTNSADRTTAQHVRLPMVAQIVEHRAAQRHVFDVLKLLQALATAMEATHSSPHQLVFEPYRSLLAKAETPQVLESKTPPVARATAKLLDTRPRFALRNVKALLGDLLSEDTSAQANMASRHDFRPGQVLNDISALELASELTSMAQDQNSQLRVLNGLQFLAPYVSPEAGTALWQVVKNSVNLPAEPNLKLRALWGDVRSLLGCDDRFDLPDRPYVMKERFEGHNSADEPIPGFVRVPAGQFTMGSKADSDNQPRQLNIAEPFYMQRTLVTVDQYDLFLQGLGYVSDAWWDKQGIEWRNGKLDSKVQDEALKKWLDRRTVDLRTEPMGWETQKAFGGRPVHGVTWFEARAYARWLNERMRSHITESGLGAQYQVLLPTEVQWERAARASSLGAADDRVWPWGDDDALAENQANLGQKIGSVCAVGLYPPNPIGLYDMAGNAREWMDNLYQPKQDDFSRIKKDQDLVSLESTAKSDSPALRGGSWFSSSDDARCSCRGGVRPDGWGDGVGFRVVLSLAK